VGFFGSSLTLRMYVFNYLIMELWKTVQRVFCFFFLEEDDYALLVQNRTVC